MAYESHKKKKGWIDLHTLKIANLRNLSNNGLTIECTKKAIGKGKRLIITDAMTKGELLTGASMIFKANKAIKSSEKSRPVVNTENEVIKRSCVDSKVQLDDNNDDSPGGKATVRRRLSRVDE